MKHVFISYKHEADEAKRLFIQLLKLQLKSAGLDVWIDEEIQGGEDWRERIEEAIKNAFACVVVMTKEARISDYVTYEWSYALHPRLEPFQSLDFTGDVFPWAVLQKRLQDIRLDALIARAAGRVPDELEADRISNMIFRAIAEAFRHTETGEVATEQIISMLGFYGLLNLDQQAELLKPVLENRNRFRKV